VAVMTSSFGAVLLAALCLCSDALRLPTPGMSRSRTTRLSMGLFGGDSAKGNTKVADSKALDAVFRKPQDEWTDEDKKTVTRVSGNWAEYKKPNQDGYTFFQGPTPKSGVQEGMPGFFSSEARDGVEAPLQLKVFGGIAVVGVLALFGTVLTA